MSLTERINEDMKTAMKAQNVELLATVRMLKSALKNTEISLGHELSDVEAFQILEKQAKQRRDSIDQYKAGNRDDLAEKEAAELAIIETYLPEKIDGAALEVLIDQAIVETGASQISDMGKVMKLVIERAAGAANGKEVSDAVRQRLA